MDALMVGAGVGFSTYDWEGTITRPTAYETVFVVPDTREGWVLALQTLIESYENGTKTVRFDYSEVRPAGSPIKSFGGTASGHGPLEKGLERIRGYLDTYVAGETSRSRTVIDVMNAIGALVVSGNVRRSAEIALGSPDDDEFLNFKNYEIHPERAEIGWLSNNSYAITDTEQFQRLPEIAERVRDNGEPGIINFLNIQKYGRMFEKAFDPAVGCNPCAEATLESYELCNLSEVMAPRCVDEYGNFSPKEFYKALRLATTYSSTIALLPTHSDITNGVIAHNRRIGVSISGIADWMATQHSSHVITWLDNGYKVVVDTNKECARAAGVPESVRKTVIKPSGSISLLAGVSAGMHLPPYSRYIRRMRLGANTPLVSLLEEAGVPLEPDVYSDNTLVAEFPVDQGKVRGQKDVSMWAKASTVMLLQRWFADQMVSNTITVREDERDQVEDLLTFTVPNVKSLSLLPMLEDGTVYQQQPIEQATLEEVNRRKKEIREVDWSKFGNSDGDAESVAYCSNDNC